MKDAKEILTGLQAKTPIELKQFGKKDKETHYPYDAKFHTAAGEHIARVWARDDRHAEDLAEALLPHVNEVQGTPGIRRAA